MLFLSTVFIGCKTTQLESDGNVNVIHAPSQEAEQAMSEESDHYYNIDVPENVTSLTITYTRNGDESTFSVSQNQLLQAGFVYSFPLGDVDPGDVVMMRVEYFENDTLWATTNNHQFNVQSDIREIISLSYNLVPKILLIKDSLPAHVEFGLLDLVEILDDDSYSEINLRWMIWGKQDTLESSAKIEKGSGEYSVKIFVNDTYGHHVEKEFILHIFEGLSSSSIDSLNISLSSSSSNFQDSIQSHLVPTSSVSENMGIFLDVNLNGLDSVSINDEIPITILAEDSNGTIVHKKWIFGGQEFEGDEFPSMFIAPATPNSDFSITVIAIDNDSNRASLTKVIPVYASAPILDIRLGQEAVPVNGTIHITASAIDDGKVLVWEIECPGNSGISGKKGNWVITAPEKEMLGFMCEISAIDDDMLKATDTVTIRVTELPPPVIQLESDLPVELSINDTMILVATASEGDIMLNCKNLKKKTLDQGKWLLTMPKHPVELAECELSAKNSKGIKGTKKIDIRVVKDEPQLLESLEASRKKIDAGESLFYSILVQDKFSDGDLKFDSLVCNHGEILEFEVVKEGDAVWRANWIVEPVEGKELRCKVSVRDNDGHKVYSEAGPVEIKKYTVVTNSQNGSIDISQKSEVLKGAILNIVARPNAGYFFDGWLTSSEMDLQLSSFEDSSTTVKVNQEGTLTAVFKPVIYTIQVTQPEHGKILINGEERTSFAYEFGSKQKVRIESEVGYEFKSWKNSNVKISGETIFEVNPFRSTFELGAELVKSKISIVVTDQMIGSMPMGQSHIDGQEGEYQYIKGQQANPQLKAIAKKGFLFKKWTTNGVVLDEEENPAAILDITSKHPTIYAEYSVKKFPFTPAQIKKRNVKSDWLTESVLSKMMLQPLDTIRIQPTMEDSLMNIGVFLQAGTEEGSYYGKATVASADEPQGKGLYLSVVITSEAFSGSENHEVRAVLINSQELKSLETKQALEFNFNQYLADLKIYKKLTILAVIQDVHGTVKNTASVQIAH